VPEIVPEVAADDFDNIGNTNRHAHRDDSGRFGSTLRVTPAMEAGLAHHVWERIGRIVGLLA
jgi:hypothetical protein